MRKKPRFQSRSGAPSGPPIGWGVPARPIRPIVIIPFSIEIPSGVVRTCDLRVLDLLRIWLSGVVKSTIRRRGGEV